MSEKHEYKPLMGEAGEDIQDLESTQSTTSSSNSTRSYWFNLAFTIICVVSVSLNIVQFNLYKTLVSPTTKDETWISPSTYARLEGERTVYWEQWGPYSSHDDDARDHLWDSLDIDSGLVAVDKSWAKEKGLPEGTTFPWDSDKALYFVNAYHNQHCLKTLYQAFREIRLDLPRTVEIPHANHCLDQLLADTFCTADDTLRVTNRSTPHTTGAYQYRQCRNWDALRQWTLDHPGCYRYGNKTQEDDQPSQVPRMRYCPEGSPELERVREYFGKGKDWKPAEEKKYSWFD
ncbi:hypothetical protein GGR54DRAFT_623635 [Hypoxylon sp. NC1633]|nr:hypothetical protein GGR54DRAFT_623635 [Hypoxylon sp. NC1633]